MKGNEQKKFKRTIRDTEQRIPHNFSVEEKVSIILEGMRGEDKIATICNREGINKNVYYQWRKAFLRAGKEQLMRDSLRRTNVNEVKRLRDENRNLKELIADLVIERTIFKKNLTETMPN